MNLYLRPKILDCRTANGDVHTALTTLLEVHCLGWGLLTVESPAEGPTGGRRHRWLPPGEHLCQVAVPAGARVEIRFGNIFGRNVQSAWVPQPSWLLVPERFRLPNPPRWGVDQQLPTVGFVPPRLALGWTRLASRSGLVSPQGALFSRPLDALARIRKAIDLRPQIPSVRPPCLRTGASLRVGGVFSRLIRPDLPAADVRPDT